MSGTRNNALSELRAAQAAALEAWRGRALAAEAALERAAQAAQQREMELLAQIRMVMEERFYHPVITERAQPAAPVGSPIPAEALGGAYPDEAAIRQEFDALVAEHEEARNAVA